jgi:hypothetical protein
VALLSKESMIKSQATHFLWASKSTQTSDHLKTRR